jgi:hypothetical protein
MMDCRRCHRSGADFVVRRKHLLDRAEGAAAELARHGIGALQNWINHPNQANRLALFLQFLVNPGVIASKDANTDDCD